MGTPDQILISEEGYEGKYVALRSMSDRTVIASGDDPETVMKEAQEQGADNPVIFFVPGHDITLVY
jgi:high-affinity K+ transport system ATPase subunit B